MTLFRVILIIFAFTLTPFEALYAAKPDNTKDECGKWQVAEATSVDSRIQLSSNDNNLANCASDFRLSNETDAPWQTGGYVLEVTIATENAAVEWNTGTEYNSKLYLLPQIEINIKGTPSDRNQVAQFTIEGVVSKNSFIIDLGLFLLKTGLAFIPVSGCLISDEILLFPALRASDVLAPAVAAIFRGDFIEAGRELRRVLPEFYRLANEVFQNASIGCGLEVLIHGIAKQYTVVAQIILAFLGWVGPRVMDHFRFQGQSAILLAKYNPAIQGDIEAKVLNDKKIYLGDRLIFNMSNENLDHCFGVSDIIYSPSREYFVVIIGCVEGDNELFLFKSDGSKKVRITKIWGYINYFEFQWAPDSRSFSFSRINSCCVSKENIPPDAPRGGYVQYHIETEKEILLGDRSVPFDDAFAPHPLKIFDVTGVEPGDVLNIRDRFSSTAPIVGTIPPNGTGIKIVGWHVRNEDVDWVFINYRGVEGYVNGRYLALNPKKLRIINVEAHDVLYVRDFPDSQATSVVSIPFNASGIDLASGQVLENEGNLWVPVVYNGMIGWVNGYFLATESL